MEVETKTRLKRILGRVLWFCAGAACMLIVAFVLFIKIDPAFHQAEDYTLKLPIGDDTLETRCHAEHILTGGKAPYDQMVIIDGQTARRGIAYGSRTLYTVDSSSSGNSSSLKILLSELLVAVPSATGNIDTPEGRVVMVGCALAFEQSRLRTRGTHG